MAKAGIYCRLSIEDRNKLKTDDSQSIQNQKSMLLDYCRERNWEIYDIYCDDGYSGVDRNRPEFKRLLHDCENGHIDIVLCKDQSRFSRDIIVIEQYINDKFLEWGIRFIGVADNADSDSEIYSTMRLFTSAYNEMYVKDISSKIKRTLTFKREQGQFIGSFAPYGYLIDPEDKHRLIIDKNTADNVRLIFDMFVNGNGYRKIAQKLNNRNIPSPSAYKKQTGSKYVNCNANSSSSNGLWTQSTISVILRNEMYTGTLVQGKSHHISYKNKKRKKVNKSEWVRIPDTHEAIIDREMWECTQERLNSRTRSSRVTNEVSALSGKVKCAVCGRPMKRNIYYNKAKTIKYYGMQCATYKTGAMNCTNIKTMSGKVLEQKVLDELNNIIEHYCQTDEIVIDDICHEQLQALEYQRNNLEEQLQTARNRLTMMYKDKLDGIISEADYRAFRENLSADEQNIIQRLAEIENHIDKRRTHQENAENQCAVIEKYTHFTALDRSIVEEFIDFIEVDEVLENSRRAINIHWKL
ncbi:MAG: recombinase family protein [Ruminococcus flavefaciens]|nr:recombinase family protein [Ruminococcus flavefaciens]